MKIPREEVYVGSHLNLREKEFEFIIRHPGCSLTDVVDSLRTKVIGGFETGEQLVLGNRDWWL